MGCISKTQGDDLLTKPESVFINMKKGDVRCGHPLCRFLAR